MTNTNKLIAAMAAGVAIGSLLGILFAPDKGENTRKKIVDNGKKLSDTLKDRMNEGKNKLSGLRDNIRGRVDSLKETVEEFAS
ncbi:YtxH domain-containing protein [Flavihumibacter profundi]|uniref:YtxH domain-containing protein n=1 Tax=Flavihumibacter profundi TaxID=2716883 RepID=UPI001CC783DA|nr:YtxH domain-containing protein [Flavihumibacter profundi]MBZ5859207.1 YtxH domain-containing protein [Flavihumibacter profundi]